MEIFWRTIAYYNSATWLLQIIVILIGIVLTALLISKPRPWVKMGMKIYMIGLYSWISIVYYFIYCEERSYNGVMAMFWGVMAIIWIWDAITGYTTFERTHKYDLLSYVLLAMPFIYPMVSLARGLSFPEMTSPVMPCSVVVFTIGLSLYPTAINYMAGGTSNPDYGSWQNWLVAFFTLAVVTVLNHFGKGIWKLSSILIGMLAGYVVSIPFGMVDLSSVGKASVFQVPQPLHFGVHFEISACVAIGLLFAINSIQAIGDYSATTIGAMNRTPKDSELQGGIVAYGITNILGALFGGLPTATYSQNVGIVTTTKVINRWVLGLAAAFLGIAGFVPKFSALLTTIPQCVLGGATVSVFASIAMTGMKLVASAEMDYRNSSIVGLAAALGVGVSQANAALATLPAWVTTIFGKSPVVLATIIAVCLNLILPKSRDEEKEEKIYDSLLILTDIIGESVSYTREHLNYILVYNEVKNSDNENINPKTKMQDSPAREEISKSIFKLAKDRKIGFGLDKFKGYCFKEVATYTKEEFEQEFVAKISS